jgi:glycosyltransferase involved in cell wall biosynthesis
MRIGIIGTRGIPNQYGGFEQFTQFVAPGLADRGNKVFVYNSSLHPFKEKKWRGVNIISKYDPEDKIGTAGQFVYDLNCILDARARKFDIILQLGYTSSSIWQFLIPKNTVLITNMDGLEWKRSKYSPQVQKFLQKAEKWAAISSDFLIADSIGIQEYLLQKYRRNSFFIPYGAEIVNSVDKSLLIKKGITYPAYNLLIARMEPENNIEVIIQGHLLANTAMPLIIVGSYKNSFGSYLKKRYESSNIIFFGAIYDLFFLNSLRFYSNLYFHGHSVGGTNPSLLEAMASHALIIAHDNIFNKAVLGNEAFYFTSSEDIAELLKQKLQKADFANFIKGNIGKIEELYTWNKITDQLEKFLRDAISGSSK